jgi:transformation/transcription domain-associated protein
MYHRLPISETLRPHVRSILNLIFDQVKNDNEENGVVCLRTIIEFHKQFRPPFSSEVTEFLSFVKSVYKALPIHMDRVFDPRLPMKVANLSDLNMEEILEMTFTQIPVILESKPLADNATTPVSDCLM